MTCFAVRRPQLGLPVLGLLALFALACASGGGGPVGVGTSRSSADLTNPFLGPEYSGWMIGAISRFATPEEIERYQALRDDADAAAFVEEFWVHRDPSPDRPGNAIREAFDRRSAEADRMLSESGYLGRRTDRGLVLILYGPPTKIDFDVAPYEDGPAPEVWTYDAAATAETGLDGRRPFSVYRFLKRGDRTTFYVPGQMDDLRLQRRRIDSPPY